MGIVLTRYAMKKECPSLEENIKIAIDDDIRFYKKTLSRRTAPKGNSLCHGLAGIAIINKIIINRKNLSHYKELLEKDYATYNPNNIIEDKILMTGKLGEYYAHLFLTEKMSLIFYY